MIERERQAPGDELANPLRNCPTRVAGQDFAPEQAKLIARALNLLREGDVPVLLAGAIAKHAYTGVWRNTKDLDLFLRPDDVPAALDLLAEAGFETELRDPTWLAKAWIQPYLIDLIFGIGNHEMQFDDGWIERGIPFEICGVETRLISLEDLIVSKIYVVKRDRFDGSDIVHLIRCGSGSIDWNLILEQLQENRQLLLWYLVLFDYVYPDLSTLLPRELMAEMFEEMRARWENGKDRDFPFRGTLLDDEAFSVDVQDWGYRDTRKPGQPVPRSPSAG